LSIWSAAKIFACLPGIKHTFLNLETILSTKPGRARHDLAEQATHGPHACGDAIFIEVYAKSLPALLRAAIDAHEQALARAD
jgi:hypothetical protein